MRQIKNLITSPRERDSRQQEKRQKVLKFLRQHIWSTQQILQQVIGLESRQATHKTLLQLETELLIKRHTFNSLGGPVTLWGITPHGQGMAFTPGQEPLISAYFEPSKISEQNIRHQLDIQLLRIKAEASGWSQWIDGDRIGNIEANGKRPDAIAVDPSGSRVAIECERTIKTVKRYEQILVTYLIAIKAGSISRVIWATPTAELATRLQSIIFGINSVRVAGEKVAIDRDRHHKNLFFVDYDRWPNV